ALAFRPVLPPLGPHDEKGRAWAVLPAQHGGRVELLPVEPARYGRVRFVAIGECRGPGAGEHSPIATNRTRPCRAGSAGSSSTRPPCTVCSDRRMLADPKAAAFADRYKPYTAVPGGFNRKQNEASLTGRIDYTVSPTLTVQLYAQPYVSKGT